MVNFLPGNLNALNAACSTILIISQTLIRLKTFMHYFFLLTVKSQRKRLLQENSDSIFNFRKQRTEAGLQVHTYKIHSFKHSVHLT